MKIAIVIPTFQEAKNIKKLIEAVFLNEPRSEVIVVDDNSPDGTAEIVKKLKFKHKKLWLINRSGKGGRGSAVLDGFRLAYEKLKPDVYAEMDADFSHEPKELPNLIALAKKKTVVLASRYVRGSRIVNWPLKRHIMSQLSNKLIRVVLGFQLRDNTNGYRIYKEDAIKILLQHRFVNSGYIVLSESAYLLKQKGFQLIEVPSVFVNTKSEKSNASLQEFLNAFRGLLKIVKIKINQAGAEKPDD